MTIIFFQHVDLDGSQSKLKSLKIQTIDISFFPVSSKAAAGSSSCQLLRSSQRHIQYIKGGGVELKLVLLTTPFSERACMFVSIWARLKYSS